MTCFLWFRSSLLDRTARLQHKQVRGVRWSMIKVLPIIFPALRRPTTSHRFNRGSRPRGGAAGGMTAMKKFSSISAALFFVLAFLGPANIVHGSKGSLATVTGSVRDNKGNP